MVTGNAINANDNGLVRYDGNGTFDAVTTTQHAVQVGSTSNGLNSLSLGNSGEVLTSNGIGLDPSFQSISSTGAITTITGNTGGPQSPSSGNFNILGSGSITINGTLNTETVSLTGLTNHNVLVGAGTDTITKVAPSATSGIPLVSNGVASDPSFTTAVVEGGGTGQVTLTNHGVLIGQGTSPVASTATGSVGQVLQSGGAGADPSYSTATYPSTAGTSGNVITSDGTNFTSQALPAFPTTTLTNHSVALGTGTANLSSVGPSATTGSILQSAGSSADPVFSTASYPSTSGTSGTLLQSNGTNFINTTATYPSVAGTSGNLLTSDGTNWISSAPVTFSQIVVQVFTSSGTYTPTSGMKYCTVEVVGGGGGGGGCGTTNTGTQASAGGGGAGGRYTRETLDAATIGASVTVTIGAGGTAGAALNASAGNGGIGGTTFFVGICSAAGGSPGTGGTATTVANVINGGVVSTGDGAGDFTGGGSPGFPGISLAGLIAVGGAGGNSVLGAGARSTGVNPIGGNAPGTNGVNYGGGGSGGAGQNSVSGSVGGAGAPGIVIVTEYI